MTAKAHRADGADPARFGRCEHAEIDAAQHQDEQGDDAPNALQRPEPVGPGSPRAGRPQFWTEGDQRLDHENVEENGYDSRNDPGDEELADVLFDNDAVDHQRDAWRNENAHRPAGRDGPGCEIFVVAISPHRRHGDFRHGRGGGDRAPGYRAEAAAGSDRRHRETALVMAEPGIRRVVQIFRQCGAIHERSHQHEQRQHGKRITHREVEDQLTHGLQRRLPSAHEPEPDETDRHHGESERETQKHHEQQYRETGERFGHPAVPRPASAFRSWTSMSRRTTQVTTLRKLMA